MKKIVVFMVLMLMFVGSASAGRSCGGYSSSRSYSASRSYSSSSYRPSSYSRPMTSTSYSRPMATVNRPVTRVYSPRTVQPVIYDDRHDTCFISTASHW